MKCFVKGCQNCKSEGEGITFKLNLESCVKIGTPPVEKWICLPCANAAFLGEDKSKTSQVSRNLNI